MGLVSAKSGGSGTHLITSAFLWYAEKPGHPCALAEKPGHPCALPRLWRRLGAARALLLSCRAFRSRVDWEPGAPLASKRSPAKGLSVIQGFIDEVEAVR
jgi:hypothetical protein